MTGPYEMRLVNERLEAHTNQLDRIEELLQAISSHILSEKVAALNPQRAELSPAFPAANQPEEGDQAQPEPSETTEAKPETTGETTRETAGNTETVGQTRIGAAE